MTTPLVSLRQFDLSDVDDFWVWASDDRVAAVCSWDAYKSKDDLLRYMEETVLPNPWFRAIIVDGRPIGAISIKFREEPAWRHRGEIGYVLATNWWGKGVMTMAVRVATATALAENEVLERVEALVEKTNEASQRVLEKVGFKREGVMRKYWLNKGLIRDLVMYSFIRGDTFLV